MEKKKTYLQFKNRLGGLLPALERKYGVTTLALFGSYVKGTQQPDSDLDILVTFTEPPGLLRFVELENFLSDTLGVKVDLVMQEALKPAIGKIILREQVPVNA